ncbi:hypothetical protein DIPPA_02547 [Diplonema papillatum]|nr:hypothetical protein DIPPA_02547 [Diplonema papillatum]
MAGTASIASWNLSLGKLPPAPGGSKRRARTGDGKAPLTRRPPFDVSRLGCTSVAEYDGLKDSALTGHWFKASVDRHLRDIGLRRDRGWGMTGVLRDNGKSRTVEEALESVEAEELQGRRKLRQLVCRARAEDEQRRASRVKHACVRKRQADGHRRLQAARSRKPQPQPRAVSAPPKRPLQPPSGALPLPLPLPLAGPPPADPPAPPRLPGVAAGSDAALASSLWDSDVVRKHKSSPPTCRPLTAVQAGPRRVLEAVQTVTWQSDPSSPDCSRSASPRSTLSPSLCSDQPPLRDVS